MRLMVMADRVERGGEIEAEPVVLELVGGVLRLALDDGGVLALDVEDVLDVILGDVEGERAA